MTVNNLVKSRVCDVIASVLGVPASVVLENSNQDMLAGWDSLAHIHLVMGLEAEFDVSFSIDEALAMTSVPAICAALASLDRLDNR